MTAGGINPPNITPDSAANWGPLSEWASASKTDWVSSWAQQVGSVAQQFVNFDSALDNISEVVDADLGELVKGAFEGIKGVVFTLFPWFQNLTALFGGADLLVDPGDFDIAGVLGDLATAMGFGGAVELLENINLMLRGDFVVPVPSHLPMELPETLSSGTLPPLLLFLKRLVDFLNVGNWLGNSFNAVDAVSQFIEGALKPSNLLAWLQDGVLPDALSPKLLLDIINTIDHAFNNVPIVGNLVDPIFDAIRGLLGIGNTAQGSANNANTQVAAIMATLNANDVPNGVKIIEDFNEPQSTFLPPERWQQLYFGPGGGSWGINGQGDAIWYESGAAVRGVVNRHRTPLHTAYQTMTLLLPNRVQLFSSAQAATRMHLRMNEAMTDWVEVELVRNTDSTLRATMAYAVGGEAHVLGAPEVFPDADGDSWEYRAGTKDNIREFELLRNGFTVMKRTDSTAASLVNTTTHLYSANSNIAGVTVAFFVFSQRRGPRVSIYVAADRQV